MVAHKDLTGAELHEPKGVASASAGQVYAADGSGSGTWKTITTAELDTTSIKNANKEVFYVPIGDVGTAGNFYLVFPFAGTFVKATLVISGAITTADSTITFTNSGGGSLGTLTAAFSGSGEGSVFSMTPSGNQTFAANGYVKIANDGGASGSASGFLTIEYLRT